MQKTLIYESVPHTGTDTRGINPICSKEKLTSILADNKIHHQRMEPYRRRYTPYIGACAQVPAKNLALMAV
ncbi:MAG: hypothetical protein F4245_01055 [Cenarchaeum sp. SB0678_bin_8]|nr:hypothetical protein [Cenarchaeum sp. SB0666_bin_15]MYB46800.1 hypothetical protein [Cenarchaeum sp. SB0662_bin_33]MYD58198.1 hypothetical protein [Cenarchaeum sp. SB0678_bin_8]